MTIAAFTTARDRLLAAEQTPLSSDQVCAEIALAIKSVAPFDAAAVMTTDPDTHLPAGGIVNGFDPSACVPFWDNELLDPDFNKFNDLARSVEPVATLVDATDGDLARSPRFQKLYAAYGATDELRVAFTSGSTCLGIGAFLRCGGDPFTPTEIRDVCNLVVVASKALRKSHGYMSGPLPGNGPAVLILDAAGSVISMSEGADELLEDLRIEALDEKLPGTILIAASKARSSRVPSRLTTRLRGRSGRWVRIHVSPMAGESETVSVTIDAAAPSDLVPILLDSYGLTERETDLVLALCRGLGTKEMASELAISVHTVRDHLKTIFDKAEVNSRGELVAKLFANHVIDSFEKAVGHL